MLLVLVKRLLLLIAIGISCSALATINVKPSAPQTYVVKEGDTLWDIAGLYLEKPWLWPELWRNNIYIQNPHLIYPGNILKLVFNENGEPSLSLSEPPTKPVINLSPQITKNLKSGRAIPLLSWQLLQSHVERDLVINSNTYEQLPYLLGDATGGVRFANDDVVLGAGKSVPPGSMMIIRKAEEIRDAEGSSLGVKVRHVANASLIESELQTEFLISVEDANFEVKQGDRLFPEIKQDESESVDFQAATSQFGRIVGSLQDHSLMGKYDVVVLDLGKSEVTKGTVMGIYMQGSDIIDATEPAYQDVAGKVNIETLWEEVIQQPALKVGELVVFRVFDNTSFGLISSSTNIIRHGALVAKP